MSKLFLIIQLLFHLIISIEIHNPLKLVDFSRTKFTLDNEYVVLEYTNNIEKNSIMRSILFLTKGINLQQKYIIMILKIK